MYDNSVILPISAAFLHGTGFFLYNFQTKLGQSKPNPASWFLWAFLATLNAVSFRQLNDPLAALQFTAGSVGCIATFLYVMTIGKFARPSKNELVMLAVGMLGILVWKNSELKVAYPILVVVIIWSFIPTVWSVWKNPMHEKPTAWWFWTTAFSLTSIYTFFWKGGWTISMAVPLAGVIMHGIVPCISTEKRKDLWLGNKYFELAAVQKRMSEINASIQKMMSMGEEETNHYLDVVVARYSFHNLRYREAELKKQLGIV